MPSFSKEEEVYPSSHEEEGGMTMGISFLSSVESCEGGHGMSSTEEELCPSY